MSQRIFDICVKGEMSPALREAFEDVEITVDHGVTRLRVVSGDGCTLHGILDRLDSFGLELLQLRSVEVSDITLAG
jgi:hypothetical protein